MQCLVTVLVTTAQYKIFTPPMFAAARAGGTRAPHLARQTPHSSPLYCNLEDSLSSSFPAGDNTQPLLLLSQCRREHYLYGLNKRGT